MYIKLIFPFIQTNQSSLTLFTRYRETVQEGYSSDDSQLGENNIQPEMESDDTDDDKDDDDDEK